MFSLIQDPRENLLGGKKECIEAISTCMLKEGNDGETFLQGNLDRNTQSCWKKKSVVEFHACFTEFCRCFAIIIPGVEAPGIIIVRE